MKATWLRKWEAGQWRRFFVVLGYSLVVAWAFYGFVVAMIMFGADCRCVCG